MGKISIPAKARQRAIIEIMERGIESPTEIVRILESDYGIKTTRQTVYRDIANGVQPINNDTIEEHKINMLDQIDEMAEVMRKKALAGNTQAANTFAKMQETKVRVLARIVEIQAEMNRRERPIYNVVIGDFPAVNKKEDKENKKEKKDKDE